MAEATCVSLRDFDDVSCSNIVVSRDIRRLIKKFPAFNKFPVDCYVHNGHYTTFEFKDGKFVWTLDNTQRYKNAYTTITNDDDFLTANELNKLICCTYRTMCDSKDSIDLIDSPEDILAYAEQQLQSMLKDNNED